MTLACQTGFKNDQLFYGFCPGWDLLPSNTFSKIALVDFPCGILREWVFHKRLTNGLASTPTLHSPLTLAVKRGRVPQEDAVLLSSDPALLLVSSLRGLGA